MTVDELYSIFRQHVHSGTLPDARKLPISSIGIGGAIPVGLVNGINMIFTIPSGLDSDKVIILVDGIIVMNGYGATVSGTTITLETPPIKWLKVLYFL